MTTQTNTRDKARETRVIKYRCALVLHLHIYGRLSGAFKPVTERRKAKPKRFRI